MNSDKNKIDYNETFLNFAYFDNLLRNIFEFFSFEFSARVLRPGRPIPPDLRNYATQIPDMGASTCAVVDFESTDSGKIDDLIRDPL